MSNGNVGNQIGDSEGLPSTAVEPSEGMRSTTFGGPSRFRVTKRWRKAKITDETWSLLYRRQLEISNRATRGVLCTQMYARVLQSVIDGKILVPKSLMPDLRTQVNTALMINRMFDLGVSETIINLGLSDAEQLLFENRVDSLRSNQAYVFTVTFGEIGVCLEKLWEVIRTMHFAHECNIDFKKCTRERFRSGYNNSACSFELVDFGNPAEETSVQRLRTEMGSKLVLADVELFWALIYNPRLLSELQGLGFANLIAGNTSLPSEIAGDKRVLFFEHQADEDIVRLKHGSDYVSSPHRSVPRTVVQ